MLRSLFVLVCLVSVAFGAPGAFASTKHKAVAKPAVQAPVAVPDTNNGDDNNDDLSSGSGQDQPDDEKQQAMDDVDALIIDSYRAQLDRILADLYENISVSTKGDVTAQVAVLDRVRSDLDSRLDSLTDPDVSPNRKKILLGVYFYLKSDIESHIRELKGTNDQ